MFKHIIPIQPKERLRNKVKLALTEKNAVLAVCDIKIGWWGERIFLHSEFKSDFCKKGVGEYIPAGVAYS